MERDNNFDPLRMIAAGLVLFSHSYPLYGRQPEPLAALSGDAETWGGVAVAIFFFMSGFLLTGSLERGGGLARYAIGRALRLLPALGGAVLVTAFAIGPLFTRLSLRAYLASGWTWSYLGNAAVFPLQYPLPGLFEANPYASVVNGSLWTLPVEVCMYVLLPALAAIGALRGWRATLAPAAFVVALALARTELAWGWQNRGPILLHSVPAYNFVELGVFFFVGACFRVHRRRIPADWRIAALLAAIAVAGLHSRFSYTGLVVALPYLVYWIAMAPIPLHAITTRIGDISYGFYLYAFPVQQAVWQLLSGVLGFWELMATAFAATTALAWLSWRWIERPALAWKARLAG